MYRAWSPRHSFSIDDGSHPYALVRPNVRIILSDGPGILTLRDHRLRQYLDGVDPRGFS